MLIGWGSPTRATSSESPADSRRPVIVADIGKILTIGDGFSSGAEGVLATTGSIRAGVQGTWDRLRDEVPAAVIARMGIRLRASADRPATGRRMRVGPCVD